MPRSKHLSRLRGIIFKSMNKTILYIIGAAALFFTSCNKFLEHNPDQRSEIETGEQLSELLVSAYPLAAYQGFLEAKTDNIVDNFGMPDYIEVLRKSFLFEDPEYEYQDSPIYYWSNAYKAIASANEALVKIAALPNPEAYNDQKGEALVARAYAHFMLVNLFSKFYHAETASKEPGIPYVMGPQTDLTVKYERETVAITYQKIEADLVEGLRLIKDGYKATRYHFTRSAAHAFASRFYLYQKRYQESLRHAEQAIPGDMIMNLRDYLNVYDKMSWNEFGQHYMSSKEKSNLLIVSAISNYGYQYHANRYSTNQNVFNELVENTPAGLLDVMYYNSYQRELQSYFFEKYDTQFIPSGANATIGLTYTGYSLFDSEEVFFNRMESLVYLGRIDEAVGELNRYVATRVYTYTPARAISKQSIKNYFFSDKADYNDEDYKTGVIETILNFRRVEFLHQGLRYFDLLRHKRTIKRRTNDGKEFEINYDDNRTVAQMPAEVVSSGITLNPR